MGSDQSRRYVVDGDNLIGSWGGPRPGEDRRSEVVQRVDLVCARLGADAIVVFDPGRSPEAAARVTVCVAPAGEKADDVIRTLVDASPSPSTLTVVSSDKPVYSYARTRGALILRAHEWNALAR